MFVYCNNNPITKIDDTGEVGMPCTVRINDGGYADTAKTLVGIANSIGARANIESDSIEIDLEKEKNLILSLNSYGYLSMEVICSAIADGASRRFEVMNGRPFLLSEECMSSEIYNHLIPYLWTQDQKLCPNLLGYGFYVGNGWSMSRLEAAVVGVSIRESDVVCGGGWLSQASVFNYKDGIRDCYIGTERDPWRNRR